MATTIIDISGIDHAELLRELHAGTRALGMGRMHDRGPLTIEQCRDIIAGGRGPDHNPDFAAVTGADTVSFDYVSGRPIKVTFKGNELHSAWMYDRDAPGGEGECQRIVDRLRAKAVKP